MIQNRILDMFRWAEVRSTRHTSTRGCYKPVHDFFFERMRKSGFRKLGCGMYSSVWEYEGRLYKINSNINGPKDGFYAWMTACMQMPGNPALPKFGDISYRHGRYCVELERLTNQVRFESVEDVFKQMTSNQDLAEAVLLSLKVAANCCDYYGARIFDGYQVSDITLTMMVDWLDIHGGNLMLRNGVLVLNDPIARLDKPISEVYGYATNAIAA